MEYAYYIDNKGLQRSLRLVHMVLPERMLTSVFLSRYGVLYKSFDTNVLVGTVEKPKFALVGKMEEMYNYLYSKKIDLVGYKDDEIHVFEVKLKGGHSFLSQALLYPKLYIEKYQPTQKVRGGGICAYIDLDIRKQMEEFDLLVFVFPELEYLLGRV